MFTPKTTFSGAQFDYENGACKAGGEYRYVDSALNSVNINGNYVKDEVTYPFWANRDANGNVNTSGVPKEVLVEVVTEVKLILDAIEELNANAE